MAIYGLNFNSTHIPSGVLKKSTSIRRKLGDGSYVRLQGVCQTAEELDRMIVQLNNGRRAWLVDDTSNPGWKLVYCA